MSRSPTDTSSEQSCAMWTEVRLRDVASFYRGSGLSKADLSSDGRRPCIHYGELFTAYGELITNVVHGTNHEDGFFCSERHDVLMPTSDVTPDGLATASCILLSGVIIGGGILVIRAARNLLNGEFLAYMIRAHRNQVMQLVSGTTVYHIYERDMAQFTFLAPSVAEQAAIVGVLSNLDELLGALRRLIAKKRAIKQATLQQLVSGRIRLPGFRKRWERVSLGETADIRNGATPRSGVDAYWNGPIPWCTPTDITRTSGKYLIKTSRSITADGLASCSASLLPAGALLLCSRATIGEVRIAASSVSTNQGFKSLVCKDGVHNEFLYYLLLTLKSRIVERATGSTFLEIGRRDLASIEIEVPAYDEQRVIAEVLSDMDAEISALELRWDKTLTIKCGMMQQLLTGRVRLGEPANKTEGGGAS